MLIGVLFNGVLFDTLIAILVPIFLAIISRLAFVWLYGSCLSNAAVTSVLLVVKLHFCCATPVVLVFSTNVLSPIFTVIF